MSQETKKKISIAKSGKNNIQSKKIMCVETNEVFFGTREAGNKIGIDRSGIIKCCNGKQKTAGGYHWKYID